MTKIQLNPEQKAMLAGEKGPAKQMAMRLLIDLAAAAGASELVPIQSAHISGVSPLTGGLGLRRFLLKLTQDRRARIAVPTTLNAAGCDSQKFEAMRITVPGFLEESQEIVRLYESLGVNPTQSCVPYEWKEVNAAGVASWAESNAICFGNSYSDIVTNRESGLSALASALTGYTPKYGLLEETARRPNLKVIVSATLMDPADFSVLGDWIGKQRQASWRTPYGPIPLITGLPEDLDHDRKKALSAAAANYGSPMLYIEGQQELPPDLEFQDVLNFTGDDLVQRYKQLRPVQPVSLITIGCPQASLSEIRAVARLIKGKKVTADPGDPQGRPPLWVFTSATTKAIADRTGITELLEASGALLLVNTCPEVVPYDPIWVKQILTNSMKAEHYLKSGLNSIPTSVMRLADCIAVATGELVIEKVTSNETETHNEFSAPDETQSESITVRKIDERSSKNLKRGFQATGRGLPSQEVFTVRAEAFVTDTPITLLGFVNRNSGVIEEPGHPAHGRSMAGKIAIFPKGSGSTVAPYVLLELYYRGRAPLAIVNTEIDQQNAPACSLEGIPYAYGFEADLFENIRDGDLVELKREGEITSIKVLEN